MMYRRPFEVSQLVENVGTDQQVAWSLDREERTDTLFSASFVGSTFFRAKCR